MGALANDIQDRNQKIINLLSAKEAEGFKYGEVGRYLEKVAIENDVTLSTVQYLYYNQVKNKVANDSSSTSEKPTSNVPQDNIANVFTINNKEVRLVSENGEKFYVLKDVLESISVDRTSLLAKEGIKKEFKNYLPVKSAYGHVKTAVITSEGLVNFLELVIKKHTIEDIRNKAQTFLNHVQNVSEKPTNNEQGITEELSEAKEPIKTVKPNKTKEPINKKEPSSKKKHDNTKGKMIVEETRETKDTNDETKAADKKTVNESQSSVSQTDGVQELEKATKPSYKYGDVIEVQVVHVANYGALVQTLDEHRVQGLIYVGDVRYGYVADLNLYFEVGDKLKASVKRYDPDQNRLNLSTKEFKIPLKQKKEETTQVTFSEEEETSKNGSLAQELSKVKDKIAYKQDNEQLELLNDDDNNQVDEKSEEVFQEKSNLKQFPTNTSNHEVKKVSGVNKIVNSEEKTMTVEQKNTSHTALANTSLNIESNKEVERIIGLMNNKIGAISPEARAKLLEMLNERGIVDFTVALMQVIPDFKADLGLIMLSEIEKKIGEYL